MKFCTVLKPAIYPPNGVGSVWCGPLQALLMFQSESLTGMK